MKELSLGAKLLTTSLKVIEKELEKIIEVMV
jgi:hypothetical protein